MAITVTAVGDAPRRRPGARACALRHGTGGRDAHGDTRRWAGDEPFSIAYAWEACGASGACRPVRATGAHAAAHDAERPAPPGESHEASNGAGHAEAVSAATAQVARAPSASPRRDTLRGTRWSESLLGRGGNDLVLGLGGDDTPDGGTGDDARSTAVPGADRLTGGPGVDRLTGGVGDDWVDARDGRRDLVRCGSGRDTARVDRADVVQLRGRPSRLTLPRREVESARRTWRHLPRHVGGKAWKSRLSAEKAAPDGR